MHFEWVPSADFPSRCQQVYGVSLSQLSPSQQDEILREFRGYWDSQGNMENQRKWEHKLVAQIKKVLAGSVQVPGQPASRQQKRAAVSASIMNIDDTDW
jgi:hypothetical protein